MLGQCAKKSVPKARPSNGLRCEHPQLVITPPTIDPAGKQGLAAVFEPVQPEVKRMSP